MIPKEERLEILRNFIDEPTQRLSFSVRQSIEDEFEEFLEESKLANCAGNFLAWLSSPQQSELTATLFAKI